MRRALSALLAALLLLTACRAAEPSPSPQPPAPSSPVPANREEPDPKPVWTRDEGVTIRLLQDTYPVGIERLTLLLENQTDSVLSYGDQIHIEKYENGFWQAVEMAENIFWLDEAYRFPPHSTQALTADFWYLARPPLGEGLYRITESLHSGNAYTPYALRINWQLSFRVSADAQPEPDYAVFVPGQPVPLAEGCIVRTELPLFLVNTTGEDANVLLIPRLERRTGAGDWEEVPLREDLAFCGTPDPLPQRGMECTLDMDLWGGLEAGEYRVTYPAGPTVSTDDTAMGTFTLVWPEGGGLPLAD